VDPRSRALVTRVLIWILSTMMLVVLGGATVVLTDRPEFCGTCHEMKPYYDAWASGPHRALWCIDCHVDEGIVARVEHKFAALDQLKVHLTGEPAFPLPVSPSIPDTRCRRCHPNPSSRTLGFPHVVHTSRACTSCHADKGHSVTVQALSTADVYAEGLEVPPSQAAVVARTGRGAPLIGHLQVACARCHNMARTECSACHVARHKNGADRGRDCARCHKPGRKFVFTHSADAGDCDTCHVPPKSHAMPAGRLLPSCPSCHQKMGVAWTASHPAPSADCTKCHKPPGGKHPTVRPCTLCHVNIAVSFAFEHPATRAPHTLDRMGCPYCHPTNYATYNCTCHKVGSPGEGGAGQVGVGRVQGSTGASRIATGN
jgi:hypothetical protein